MKKEKQIEIYKVEAGEVVFNIDVERETILATQEQIAKLFGVQRAAITKHLGNIFNTGELEEKAVCSILEHTAADGKKYKTKHYNLDAIISVGYRVNSRKATDFRVWATKVLKSYVVDGVTINRRRLEELDAKKLREIEGALSIVKRLVASSELSETELKGVLEVISKYSPSFKVLKEYDEGYISFKDQKKTPKKLEKEECLKMIAELRRSVKGDERFGKLKNEAFWLELEIGAGVSVVEAAAELLYSIVKNRPFYDGNKQIAALLFVVFLTINNYHLAENGETKISDRALTALTLLIAESDPKEKEVIVSLICKLLEG